MNAGTGDRTVRVEMLARVEGEGGLHVEVRDGRVGDVRLVIMEPPRFFEALLRGRAYTEPPDITARICGICPVAYQMSACQAIEQACGAVVPEYVRLLRRLLYCGEWIESHALHIYLLHAPDFLGYEGALDLAKDHPDVVRRGLRLKKAGNAVMSTVGGRSVHPVNVRVGGFYRLPSREQLAALRPVLEEALDDAVASVRLVAGFTFPEFEQPQEYLALRADSGYPLESGSLVTSGGLAFSAAEYAEHVVEEHVEHSNALHARLDGRPFVVGPLARYSLNHDRLTPLTRQLAAESGLGPVCRNPFRSIVVRAIELVYAVEEALRIVDLWTARAGSAPAAGPGSASGLRSGSGTAPAAVEVPAGAGTGHGVTEAPRGVLYHRYTLGEDGTVLAATIMPPTSQNQLSIEEDLRVLVQANLDLPEPDLTHRCEQAVRNYDPCISCATHFLTLSIDRDSGTSDSGTSDSGTADSRTRDSGTRLS